ncbi:hypothetical protein JG559_11465 [Enterococcus faecalis]|uniref:Uncharacterized protein n=1 Tax=Enterococcus faecalis TaxID=1351 RepID=A0A974NZB3_ENTFL|nr:hypothetical protein JG559_11465 [Enterococcus faecalis]
MRNERYVIPVKQEYKKIFFWWRGSRPKVLQDKPYLLNLNKFLEMNNRLRQQQIAERNEITRILAELSAELVPYRREITHNAYVIGKLDFINAKARLGKELKAVVPEISQANHVVFLNKPGTRYWIQKKL